MPDLLAHADVPGIDCPYCGKMGHPTLLHHSEKLVKESGVDLVYSFCILRCTDTMKCESRFYSTLRGLILNGRIYRNETWSVWPVNARRLSEHIPQVVRSDFNESERAFGVGSYNAAALMLRACLERTFLRLGTKKQDLFGMIDEFKESEQLHPMNAYSAHATRILGKETAHRLLDATLEEVKACLDLVEKILEDLYVTPAIQATIRPPDKPASTIKA